VDFTSLEQALGGAEHGRATLQAELARLDGNEQPAVVQLTPAALERHLQGMTEKLRSEVNGKVREAIQQFIDRILVGVDGSLTIEARPYGLLGVEKGNLPELDCRQNGATPEYSVRANAGRRRGTPLNK
jgi:hypothetical protein